MRFILLVFLILFCAVSQAQVITTVAGDGTYGYDGDGGPATAANMAWPTGLAVDNSGNIFIADHDNNVIRKVDAAGIITTFAGTGILGYAGDGGPATSALLYHPAWVAVDNTGNVYFSDQNSEVIRKVDASGIITSITGFLPAGYSGDGGPLMNAQFRSITGISFDNAGNMYISDNMNNVIRKVDASGIITTVVGNGTSGFSGDGGPALSAQLSAPYKVIFDAAGNMYIPDNGNGRIRKVDNAGIITTIAGTGGVGYGGDGGPAVNAQFAYPWSIAMDNAGNLYITDVGNNVIRKIDPSGIITTFAGNGTYGYSGDGGAATSAELGNTSGVATDNAGNVYILVREYFNVVRKVNTCPVAILLQQPASVSLCNSGTAIFTVQANNANNYQWQVNTSGTWSDISNNGTYAGTNSNSLTVTVTDPTMNNYQYRCVVSNGCGYINSYAAILKVTTPLTSSVSIVASDTSICAGITAVFTALAINADLNPGYQWTKNGASVGTNDSTYTDNNIADGDVIQCIVTINNGCMAGSNTSSNNITMQVNPLLTPSVSITSSNNNICAGVPVTFNAVGQNAGMNPVYEWSKNSITVGTNTDTFTDNTLSDGDTIVCKIQSSYSCPASADATSNAVIMTVHALLSPSIAISTPNNKICKGGAVEFSSTIQNGGTNPAYQWTKNGINTGGNTDTYTADDWADGDNIQCLLTSSEQCVSTAIVPSNSISVTVYPDPVLTLDKTPSLCAGGSRVLSPGSFASYLWSNGSTSSSITVTTTGLYSVQVTDQYGCKGTDAVAITTLLAPPAHFLPNDTAVCSYSSIIITPENIYQQYQWSTLSNQSYISVSTPGTYWLSVKDNNGCEGNDTILVVAKNCLTGFYIPSAFTPNNDKLNDVFKPIIGAILKEYTFAIYNRWGQILFSTNDINKGWDGTYNGQTQNTGVFMWTCTWQGDNGPKNFEKGTVTLIR
ncbi:MAG: gliding motility-associated C-terminal domain-containing protein [Agriterribacter sp.]